MLIPREVSLSALERAHAILSSLTQEQINQMPPTARRAFAIQCRRVAEMAEPAKKPETLKRCFDPATLPKSGILHDLFMGDRAP